MRQIFLDTETTGLSADNGDRIVEIGCVELVARSKDPPREKKLKVIVEPNKNKSFRVEL